MESFIDDFEGGDTGCGPMREEGDVDEPGWRGHVSGEADGVVALAVVDGGEVSEFALRHIDRVEVGLVAHTDLLPLAGRRVGESAEGGVVDGWPAFDLFGNFGVAAGIADPPMEGRDHLEAR